MPKPTSNAQVSLVSVMTGALLGMVGLAAVWLAQNFDDESRSFPLVVASLLAISGLAILVQSLIVKVRLPNSLSGTTSVATALVAIAAWAGAFGAGAGFLLPTFFLQCVLLRLAGMRRAVVILGTAALITVLARLLFINLLDVPMPVSSLPFLLGAS